MLIQKRVNKAKKIGHSLIHSSLPGMKWKVLGMHNEMKVLKPNATGITSLQLVADMCSIVHVGIKMSKFIQGFSWER